MPTKGDTQVNTFVGGLITEASPLTFPPNASIDEVNFKLKRDGSRERRLGLDYEEDFTLHDTGLTTAQLQVARQTFFHWETPNGATEVDIGIVQVAGLLFFIDLFTENPSANLLNQGNPIDLGIPDDAILSYAIINNQISVVSASLSVPFFLTYDEATDVVSQSSAPLQIRDIYGVEDGFAAGQRPNALTPAHEYNLQNQGWNPDIVGTCVPALNPIECTRNQLGVYPSHSDTWSLGKIADVTSADVDKYDPLTLQKNSFDIGRAARGHFIIDLFDRGFSRTEKSAIAVPSIDRELGRPSTVESYAGRLFYSGITSKVVGGDNFSPNLSGAILYSQIGRSNEDLVKCYQEADPTSPTTNDAIDTDGGVIQIAGAVDIIKLKTIKTSLFVFASNGIWQIRGDDGGFRSTSFQVNKISSIGVFSPESIVEANGTIFFWAKSGIYSLTPNQVDSTTFDSTNVTITTIQRGYNSIPELFKRNVKGYYDLDENKVRWLYRSDVPETLVVPDPPVPTITIGDPITVASNFLEPKIVGLTSTTALVVYRNGTATQLNGRILTLAADLSITAGAEQAIQSSVALGGMTLTKLSDTKVLCTYLQNTNTTSRVLNVSGDTITPATAYVVNTVHSSSAYTSPLRNNMLDSGDILISFKHSTGSTMALQILQVDASDVVTFGTVAVGVDTSLVRIGAAMLGSTSGVCIGDTASGRTQAEKFTISGTTITFNGTSYSFLNTTQMPGVTYSNSTSYITESTSAQVTVCVVTTQSTPTVTSAMYQFNITDSGGVLTSTEVLKQTDEIGTLPVMLTVGSKSMTAFKKTDGANFVGRILYNNIGSSIPTTISQVSLGSDITFANPEMGLILGNTIIVVYETSTPDVKAIAGTIA